MLNHAVLRSGFNNPQKFLLTDKRALRKALALHDDVR